MARITGYNDLSLSEFLKELERVADNIPAGSTSHKLLCECHNRLDKLESITQHTQVFEAAKSALNDIGIVLDNLTGKGD